jgi:hypothetical protein
MPCWNSPSPSCPRPLATGSVASALAPPKRPLAHDTRASYRDLCSLGTRIVKCVQRTNTIAPSASRRHHRPSSTQRVAGRAQKQARTSDRAGLADTPARGWGCVEGRASRGCEVPALRNRTGVFHKLRTTIPGSAAASQESAHFAQALRFPHPPRRHPLTRALHHPGSHRIVHPLRWCRRPPTLHPPHHPTPPTRTAPPLPRPIRARPPSALSFPRPVRLASRPSPPDHRAASPPGPQTPLHSLSHPPPPPRPVLPGEH